MILTMAQKTLNKQKMKTPSNWLTCRMQEIASIYNGNSISEEVKTRDFTGLATGYNYIATKDVGFDSIINYENGVKIPFTRKDFKVAPKNTPLLCIEGGSAGRKLGFLSEDVCFGNKLCAFASPFSQWIYFYLQSSYFLNHFNVNKNGLIGGVSINKIKQITIPVPPLAEQKRIVKKIEELFEVIDEQIKKLEATQEALISYRQSILQQAFSGKLYKTSTWKKITLQKAVDINPKTVLPVLPDSEMVSFLPMPAIQEESLEYTEQKTPFGKVKKGYTKFRDNDVLFAKITPCMENGKGCIVHNLSHGIGFGSTEFHVLRCHENIFPKFIYYFVIQRSFRAAAKNKMSGAVGQQRVSAEFLKKYTITLPSLSEQKAIVKKIEKAFAFADKAQKAIADTLKQAKQLKQSILKLAFEGELAPQDPKDKPIDLNKIKEDKQK